MLGDIVAYLDADAVPTEDDAEAQIAIVRRRNDGRWPSLLLSDFTGRHGVH